MTQVLADRDFDEARTPAAVRQTPGADTAICLGDWTAMGLGRLARARPRLDPATRHVDLSAVERFDSTGALFLSQLLAAAPEAEISGEQQEWGGLLVLVREERAAVGGRRRHRREGPLARLGRQSLGLLYAAVDFTAFIGEMAVDMLQQPGRLRLGQVALELRRAGVNALPIAGLLAFLVGVVMAYQGGTTLQDYGANVFLVDLIGITMLREMAPLVVAIIVAGRTGSAYAAELGTMRITEEVDALRAMGVSPYEMLVTPKLVALVVAMPLLSVWAAATGVAGGLVVAATYYGISPVTFLSRFPDAVDASHFWLGVGKAPVFAALIAAIGCYQGLRVRGGASAVGHATTVSVVQAIFAVIVADAAFSIAFQAVGL
ncbi:ABC transporter permease [Ectothiorhodospiraceae bacterium WFHF3C12]|nr:ABC transporter permease [Ectothiorhodospiraceae bacterium WFHF3C12]